jgi:hypothetical protein
MFRKIDIEPYPKEINLPIQKPSRSYKNKKKINRCFLKSILQTQPKKYYTYPKYHSKEKETYKKIEG